MVNELLWGNICDIFIFSWVMGFWLNVKLLVGIFVKLMLIMGFGRFEVMILLDNVVCLWCVLLMSYGLFFIVIFIVCLSVNFLFVIVGEIIENENVF